MMPRFKNPAFQCWPASEPVKGGRALDVLMEPLGFVTSWGAQIEIPAHFKSDGGSIPWWGRAMINPAYNQRAWWVHDWAWENNRSDHALLLDDALLADGCMPLHRFLIVWAVKIWAMFR